MARDILTSDELLVEVTPEHGGRITRIRDRIRGREWLTQEAGPVRPARYGDSYTDRDIHGWDELLPTVAACEYADRHLPDHGELWAIPWRRHQAADGLLRLSAVCRQLPLTLRRDLRVRGTRLTLDYRCTNTGLVDLPLLWAAHPQFDVSSTCDIDVNGITRDVRVSSPAGRAAQMVTWHGCQAQAAALAPGDHVKVWLHPADQVAHLTLLDRGCSLTMSWRPQRILRNLAILWDNAAFSRQRVVAVEPSTADDESLAVVAGRTSAATLGAGRSRSWRIDLDVAPQSPATPQIRSSASWQVPSRSTTAVLHRGPGRSPDSNIPPSR